MAGILDPKNRIVDTILTEEGRRQLAAGSLSFDFVSFTDASTYYNTGSSGIVEAPEGRIYLEPVSLDRDVITPESDDTGRFSIRGNDYIVSNGFLVNQKTGEQIALSSQQYSSSLDSVLSLSSDSLRDLFPVGSRDYLFGNNSFQLSDNSMTVGMREGFPLQQQDYKKTTKNLDSIAFDSRFYNTDNFLYLPPIAEVNGEIIDFGNYKRVSNTTETSKKEYLKFVENLDNFEHKTFSLDKTSTTSNIHCQIYESSKNGVFKLDVFEAEEIENVRTFFVGKVIVDEFFNPTFVNIFIVRIK